MDRTRDGTGPPRLPSGGCSLQYSLTPLSIDGAQLAAGSVSALGSGVRRGWAVVASRVAGIVYGAGNVFYWIWDRWSCCAPAMGWQADPLQWRWRNGCNGDGVEPAGLGGCGGSHSKVICRLNRVVPRDRYEWSNRALGLYGAENTPDVPIRILQTAFSKAANITT